MRRVIASFLIVSFIFIGSACSPKVKPKSVVHITAATTVYWVPKGKVYHIDKSCVTLRRSHNIESGSPAQAKAEGKTRLCEVCGDGDIDDTAN